MLFSPSSWSPLNALFKASSLLFCSTDTQLETAAHQRKVRWRWGYMTTHSNILLHTSDTQLHLRPGNDRFGHLGGGDKANEPHADNLFVRSVNWQLTWKQIKTFLLFWVPLHLTREQVELCWRAVYLKSRSRDSLRIKNLCCLYEHPAFTRHPDLPLEVHKPLMSYKLIPAVSLEQSGSIFKTSCFSLQCHGLFTDASVNQELLTDLWVQMSSPSTLTPYPHADELENKRIWIFFEWLTNCQFWSIWWNFNWF